MSLFDIFHHGREFKPSDQLPFIASPSGEKEIALTALNIQVLVTGLYAQTTLTMELFNPNSRDMEGELNLPLPDGAAVCAYALDIDGEMVDGVIVPKEQARKILEAEIRKGVDPGLVEQAKGNTYKLRVYPVPAQGTRRIRITYINDLVLIDNDAFYHLPLSYARNVAKASLKVEVTQSPVEPEFGDFGNLSLKQWDNRWCAEADISNAAMVDDLLLRLPLLPEELVCVERVADNVYFNISMAYKTVPSAPWKPQNIGIIWDASGSRQDIKKDLALLRALEALWSSINIELLVFRDTVDPVVAVFNSFSALIEKLEGLAYDGASNINRAIEYGCQNIKKAQACFLFSDGMNNVEPRVSATFYAPIIAVNTQVECHSQLLEYIANQHSQGMFINLQLSPLDRVIEDIQSFNANINVSEMTGVESVTIKKRNGRVSLLGKLTSEQGSIKITADNFPSKQITFSNDVATSGVNIGRAWAGQEVQKLALEDDRSEALLALSREFGLVTPATSLLVLENIDQFIEYGIEPPKSRLALRKLFLQHKETKRHEKEDKDREQIERIVALWDERVKWWETDFRSLYVEPVKQSIPDSADPFSILLSDNHETSPLFAERETEHLDSDMMLCAMEPSEPLSRGESAMPASRQAISRQRKKSSSPKAVKASIQIQAWSPDTPYLTRLRETSSEQAYAVYLQQRKIYHLSPAYYLDCGDYFLSIGQPELGKRVLSNLLELQLEDIALLRIYAWRLQQANEYTLAINIFKRIRKIRDDEPQSHRDLALVLGDRWQATGDSDDIVHAMDLLYEVVCRAWERFPEIELIALMELNRLIRLASIADIEVPAQIDTRLIKCLDLDLRVSMSWDTDLTDVDLHLFEPDGSHAYYGHNKTNMGGLVSLDFTQGYGPEEYVLKEAKPGEYIIKAHYYGSHQQSITGPCTITATVFTNYARAEEVKQVLTLRLEKASDQELVGKVMIQGNAWNEEANLPADRENPQVNQAQLAAYRRLSVGMSINEVKAIVGLPCDIEGDEQVLFVYRLGDCDRVELRFEPKLTSAELKMQGANLDLI